jgi:hypothetical protein
MLLEEAGMSHRASFSARLASRSFALCRAGALILLTLLILFTPAALPAQAEPTTGTIYRVVPDGTSSGDCGDSWANACSLQHALKDLADGGGDEIWVAAGTYTPGAAREDTFQLKNGVALYGGFAGTESERSQRDWQTNETILSGDIGVSEDSSDNSYHVVSGSGTDRSAVLDGFTVTKGNADTSGSFRNMGAGMYNRSGSPTVRNTRFEGNSASAYGGGMHNREGSSPLLINVVFSGNSAGMEGGGMDNASSNPELQGVTFLENTAVYYGGGMANKSSSPILTNVEFLGNRALGTSAIDGSGGGMYNSGVTAPSSPTLTNVVFSGNWAKMNGGGMYNAAISEAYRGAPMLINVTFAGNHAQNIGGAIYNVYSDPTLVNAIVWGNTATGGYPGIFSNAALSHPTYRYSIIQGTLQGSYDAESISSVDPLFVRNPGSGDYGDLSLQATSPAIDAGDTNAVPDGVSTDLAGNPRIANSIVDMGAYEAQGPPSRPDLTLSKTNNTGGVGVLGTAFNWTLALRNEGSVAASFGSGQVILRDELPNGAGYGTPQVTAVGGLSGSASCTIDGGANLVCTADGDVSIPPGGELDLVVAVTPTAIGTLSNPRSGGVCQADPGGVVTESDETDNSASDAVTVGKASTATTITSVSPSGTSLVGETVRVSYSVAVTPPGAATPSGTVRVESGGTTLCSAPMAQGYCDLSGLAAGDYTFTATYEGDDNLLGSTSVGVAHQVQEAVSVTAQPADQTVCEGSSAVFSASASGYPTPTVQWQVSTDSGMSWTDLPGAAAATLSFTSDATQHGNRYRAVFTNVLGSIATNAATLTVNTAPAIASQPSDQTVVHGQQVTFGAAATGRPEPTVQWQVSTDGGSTWSSVTGATTTTLSFGASRAQNGNLYRALFTNGCGSTSSQAATLTVNKAQTATTITGHTPAQSEAGQAVTVQYAVTVLAPGSGTPTGNVTVSSDGDSCTGTVAAGSCSITLTSRGDKSLVAVYEGDTNMEGSTSAAVSHRVTTTPTAEAGGPYEGDERSPIQFAGSGSDVAGEMLTYSWDFGDGTTGSGPSPTHSYARSGSYTAMLTVTDDFGTSASDTASVTVRAVAPSLSGQFDQVAREGTLTSFSLGSLVDSDVDGLWSLSVDWGDGLRSTFSVAALGALTANHLYDDDGRYTVTVQATDRYGVSGSQAFRAIVHNAAPKVRIDPRVTSGTAGTQVGLWAQVSDPSRADTRAGFEYQWSLRRAGVEIGTGSASSLGFTIPAGDTAIYEASVTVRDKDGSAGYASWHMRAETRAAVDARIQILWPHGGAPVREATLANLSAWLLEPGTLRPAALTGEPVVYLWRALNNGPAEIVATGVRRGSSMLFDFNNVDVSAARDARNKLYFYISVEGVPTRSNVWAHAQDGRTHFPAQDVPTGSGPVGRAVDARIEILWPHGNARVTAAEQANLTAMLFLPGTLTSVPAEWNPTVRLYRSLDNGVAEQVAIGVKRLVTQNGVTYPVWDFNNIDVSAAKDPAHKLFFSLAVDGVETHTSVWVHGVDGTTVFPVWDIVE